MTELNLIAEQPDFLVLDKPAGISVHSEDGAGVVAQLSTLRHEPLWLVHRLDRDTSGALLLARHPAAAAALGELFATRQVAKFYLGISARRPQKKTGLVAGDMQRSRDGNWRLLREQARPALTSFVTAAAGDGLRAVLMRPWTGRTHQLRVAMKALGAPLLGDTRYGGAAADRLHLHAWSLSFVWQGALQCFRAPLPEAGAFRHAVMRAQTAAWCPPEQIVMPAPSPAQKARIGADQED
jgi:tRNA pseudouridine32 synthase / 23S rRNA pseudouridine746 synthase